MSLFQFSEPELLCFVAVLVRFGTLIAVLPITGDRFVPGPTKVLLALATTIAIFPSLVASGQVRTSEAVAWSSNAGSLVGTVALEALFGVVLGYVSRLSFFVIQFGADLAGNYMGFGMAHYFDPHQETQTQVVGEIHLALATLAFLALDGHHLLLQTSLDSYRIVGLGMAGLNALFAERLTSLTGSLFGFAIQLSAPIALVIFSVNLIFGVMSKAMPNMNAMVISMTVTAIVGLTVMLVGLPEFQVAATEVMGRSAEWMEQIARAMSHG